MTKPNCGICSYYHELTGRCKLSDTRSLVKHFMICNLESDNQQYCKHYFTKPPAIVRETLLGLKALFETHYRCCQPGLSDVTDRLLECEKCHVGVINRNVGSPSCVSGTIAFLIRQIKSQFDWENKPKCE